MRWKDDEERKAAREDARRVLREYVDGILDKSGKVFLVSEDETLDKLGFDAEPSGPYAPEQDK